MSQARTEIDRRKMNVWEALIVASLLGLGALIFRMNDAVTRLQVAAENTNRQLAALQAQLADVPALNQRVSKLEVQMDVTKADVAELRQMRGLK